MNSEYNLQGVFQCIIQFHNGCLISTTVAVVRSTKYCNNITIMAPVVTLKEIHTMFNISKDEQPQKSNGECTFLK